MNKIFKSIVSGTVVAATFASISMADEGRVAGLTLLRAIGARPAGLGEAFAAIPGDVQGVNYNPASLSTLKAPVISAAYNMGLDDDGYGNISYGYPTKFGSLFIGGAYFDAGDIDLNVNGVAQGNKKAQQDMVGLIGFSVGRNSPVSIGLSGKIFKSELAEVATASAFAGDAGLLWKTPLSGLTLGAAYQNLGSDLKYEVESESLPETLRGGAAYDIDFQKFSKMRSIPYSLLVTVDGVQTKNQDASVNAGLELSRNMVVMERTAGSATLRGGYSSGPERGTVGVGFHVGNFLIDYTIGFADNTLDNMNWANVGWIFGKSTEFEPEDSTLPVTTPSSKRRIGYKPSPR